MKILIFGNGYIGNRAKETWVDAELSTVRINKLEDVLMELDRVRPTAVLNAAGVVGKPNVDWCEDHQIETIFGNTVLPSIIAEACALRGIYLLHIGTGCIFYGNNPTHREWAEDDFANPIAVYTRCKYAADLVLSTMPNIGIARIRMPIDDRPDPKNLLDKICKYKKVVDVPNSITTIPDMLEVFHELMERRAEGIFHTVNSGEIRHSRILQLYKEYVDPNFILPEFITEEELTRDLTKKRRSNNVMSSKRLAELGLEMPEIETALVPLLRKYKLNSENSY
ncbi:MAG: sugar nucleotide-binding protein [Candidatus Paceibacterota bacterium]